MANSAAKSMGEILPVFPLICLLFTLNTNKMPKGIPKKKKAVKKTAKRAYNKRSISELVERVISTPNQQQPEIRRKTPIKDSILNLLKKHHVSHTDMDGHISLSSKMIEADILVELMAMGAQAICARYNMETKTPYLAVYY